MVSALFNDQLFVSGLIFVLALSVMIIFQSLIIGLLFNANIFKTFMLFFYSAKESIIIIIAILLCFLRMIYFLCALATSRTATGIISRVVMNKSWKIVDKLDIERNIEVAKIVEKENILNRFVAQESNIAAIEFEYTYEGVHYKRKEFFWKMDPKKMLTILSDDHITIYVNKFFKNVSFFI